MGVLSAKIARVSSVRSEGYGPSGTNFGGGRRRLKGGEKKSKKMPRICSPSMHPIDHISTALVYFVEPSKISGARYLFGTAKTSARSEGQKKNQGEVFKTTHQKG